MFFYHLDMLGMLYWKTIKTNSCLILSSKARQEKRFSALLSLSEWECWQGGPHQHISRQVIQSNSSGGGAAAAVGENNGESDAAEHLNLSSLCKLWIKFTKRAGQG